MLNSNSVTLFLTQKVHLTPYLPLQDSQVPSIPASGRENASPKGHSFYR